MLCSSVSCVMQHSAVVEFSLVRGEHGYAIICFCDVDLEMVELSMFGGITGALAGQDKPSLLLLAQAYSTLCACACVSRLPFL